MASNYTGNPIGVEAPATAPALNNPPIASLPADADGGTWANAYQAIKVAMDYIAWIVSTGASGLITSLLARANTWTGNQTFGQFAVVSIANAGNGLALAGIGGVSATPQVPGKAVTYFGWNTSGGAKACNLPDLTSGSVVQPFWLLIIKDESGNAGANNMTVSAFAGQTIDGAASKVINTNFGVLRLVGVAGGTTWFSV